MLNERCQTLQWKGMRTCLKPIRLLQGSLLKETVKSEPALTAVNGGAQMIHNATSLSEMLHSFIHVVCIEFWMVLLQLHIDLVRPLTSVLPNDPCKPLSHVGLPQQFGSCPRACILTLLCTGSPRAPSEAGRSLPVAGSSWLLLLIWSLCSSSLGNGRLFLLSGQLQCPVFICLDFSSGVVIFLRPIPPWPLQHTAMFSHASLTSFLCTSLYALSASDSLPLFLT